MSFDRLRRLRAYMLSVQATLGHIPAPVPPKPEPGWDGPTFDTLGMYEAYSRLPRDLQALAESGHVLCQDALDWQRGAADRAYLARLALNQQMLQRTELAQHMEELSKMPAVRAYLARMKTEDEDGEDAGDGDGDEGLLADVQRDVKEYVRGLLAAHGGEDEAARLAAGEGASQAGVGDAEEVEEADVLEAADRVAEAEAGATDAGMTAERVVVATAVELPERAARAPGQRLMRAWAASATALAVICAGLLIWHEVAGDAPEPAPEPTPTSTIRPINQLIQTGDLTAIVSYAEHTEHATELHVHVINTSAEPAPANLSLGADDHDPPAGPTLIPGKATQHRVLRVRKDRDQAKAVKLRISDEEVVVLNDL